MKKELSVVAAIIENHDNEILCALRSPSMSIPNHWEFPGGKVEEGENNFEAIEREIAEELNCVVEARDFFFTNRHEYESFIINLISIKCRLVSGNPTANEHSKLIWLKRENLNSLKWAPADIPIVDLLTNEEV
ncbi:NUDIX domain-containing protein [Terrilactibacillus sp. BCM23-1]|uniref:8-oxo-dGTP diphosphatase n=1 Tax=Terrilactibacillus tamarindi TaxID=2599694 RepID=A0A6N8CS91_9BACI|nr:(deoxy)nucleoside triphosphate pyrophosphohydrolase [Terrilactibacillus tamarindi]MTT31795.1 NUDIX domain-containing protein [Terrilactibacillus tamarindi]